MIGECQVDSGHLQRVLFFAQDFLPRLDNLRYRQFYINSLFDFGELGDDLLGILGAFFCHAFLSFLSQDLGFVLQIVSLIIKLGNVSLKAHNDLLGLNILGNRRRRWG